MKKLSLVLLAMMFCLVSVSAWSATTSGDDLLITQIGPDNKVYIQQPASGEAGSLNIVQSGVENYLYIYKDSLSVNNNITAWTYGDNNYSTIQIWGTDQNYFSLINGVSNTTHHTQWGEMNDSNIYITGSYNLVKTGVSGFGQNLVVELSGDSNRIETYCFWNKTGSLTKTHVFGNNNTVEQSSLANFVYMMLDIDGSANNVMATVSRDKSTSTIFIDGFNNVVDSRVRGEDSTSSININGTSNVAEAYLEGNDSWSNIAVFGDDNHAYVSSDGFGLASDISIRGNSNLASTRLTGQSSFAGINISGDNNHSFIVSAGSNNEAVIKIIGSDNYMGEGVYGFNNQSHVNILGNANEIGVTMNNDNNRANLDVIGNSNHVDIRLYGCGHLSLRQEGNGGNITITE